MVLPLSGNRDSSRRILVEIQSRINFPLNDPVRLTAEPVFSNFYQFRCTPDLKYSWVSRPYAAWLQRSRNEIIGASIEEVVGKAAFDVLRPYYERVLKGETVRLELEIEFQSSGSRWVNSVYTPTFAADGKPDGWVAIRFSLLSLVGDRLKTKIFLVNRVSIITL